MIDNQRQYPVHILILHHSVGPEFKNASDIEVQDWFSRIGKDRGYQGGAINPRHEHPSRPGQLTYAQAQFAGFPFDGNKYGYRLIDLMKLPWANVAWHAGNWDINVKSAGLENCGNYLNKLLADKQLMAIADWLRPVDRELVQAGVKEGLTILLHQEVYATACPGRIKEQRNKLVDMINNPKQWNDKLWPPATTTTTTTKAPVTTTTTTTKAPPTTTTTTTTKPASVYRVYAGEEVVYKGEDGIVAHQIYNETQPTVSQKVVQLMMDDLVIARKFWVEPQPEPDEPDTLYDWVMGILEKIIRFLKQYRKG